MTKSSGRVSKDKPSTQRGKRVLKDRAPKEVENVKQCLLAACAKTSEPVQALLKDIRAFKQPHTVQLKRRNHLHVFEDETFIERMAHKYDASLFACISHSKKRPHTIVLGRLFDYRLLDMVELGLQGLQTMEQVAAKAHMPHAMLGVKPAMVFVGADWHDDKTALPRVRNLLVDFFKGEDVTEVARRGVVLVLAFAVENAATDAPTIRMRTYGTEYASHRDSEGVPGVDLRSVGPRADFVLRRHKLADADLARLANRQPKKLKASTVKNKSKDVFGSSKGRVHVGAQNVDAVQTRKVKALRPQAGAPSADDDDVAMEQ